MNSTPSLTKWDFKAVVQNPSIFPPSTTSSTWPEIIDDLLRLRQLTDDWDGEGSLAPEASLVDGAITLAQDLQAQSWEAPGRVGATVNARITFEWYAPQAWSELEVLSPTEAEFRCLPTGTKQPFVVRLLRAS